MKTFFCFLAVTIALGAAQKVPPPSPLDLYIQQALQGQGGAGQASPGSIWSTSSLLTDGARDLKASQVNDMVTVLVTERASAVAKGTVKTARQSSVKASVKAVGGKTRAASPLANLADVSSATDLDGQGATSRETTLTATLSARVTHVLPNGYLVLEGTKEVQVNSERQLITVRGIVRPFDIAPNNIVRSDRLAQMEVRVNGKGVIGDAVRRPFFLYRLILGLLPI